MRILITLMLSCLLLVGCSDSDAESDLSGDSLISPPASIETSIGDAGPDPQDSTVISPPSSIETSIGAEFPADDPTLPHMDSAGRTPNEAQIELINALNSSDWKSAYSMYWDPGMDFELAVQEWEARQTHYDDFTVHEVRVIRPDTAILRVTFETQWTQPDGERDVVAITEPGEWWSISMEDGRWKTHWLPRQ